MPSAATRLKTKIMPLNNTKCSYLFFFLLLHEDYNK